MYPNLRLANTESKLLLSLHSDQKSLASFDFRFPGVFREGLDLTREKSNGFFGGSVYPQNDNPNVVGVYGTWMPIHTETGKQVFNKWHGVLEFNEAGKIIYLSDFFDVNGIQVQLEATPAESEQPASE